MNDLQICKRIAEIDGVDFDYNDERVMYWRKREGSPVETYNPLTNDALCFALMVKYQVKITYETSPLYYHASVFVHHPVNKVVRVGASSSNPNKAILLAIIKANKS